MSSSSQIEREVEASRANVEDTVEALKDKMSIGQMVDEAARYFGNSGGSDMVSNLGAQVRDNPLPLVLIGAGIAWLVSGRGTPHIRSGSHRDAEYRGRASDRDYGLDEDYGYRPRVAGSASVYSGASHPDYAARSYGDESWSDERQSSSAEGSMMSRAGGMMEGAGDMMEGVGDAAGRAAHGVRDAAGNLVDAAGNLVSGIASAASSVASVASRVGRTAYSAAGSVAGGARTGADAAWRGSSTAYRGASRVGSGAYQGATWVGSGAYEGVSELGYRARRSFSDVLDTEPLVLGAVGLAVGAAMGAVLPRTDTEDRYMGETRDRLREEAEEFARDKYEQGKAVASEAYRTAKEEAEAQGLTTFDEDSVVGRVGQVARATYDKVRETAEERGLTGASPETEDQSYASGSTAGSSSTAGGTSGSSYTGGGTSGSSYTGSGTSGTGYTGGASSGSATEATDDDSSQTSWQDPKPTI